MQICGKEVRMSLDAYVRCNCIREGKVSKPHPLPGRLVWDKLNEPLLSGEPNEDELESHHQWVQEACEHEGYLVSEFLGNITRIQNVREFVRGLQGTPGPRFPILLKKVVYDGTHTGDWISPKESPALLKEVNLVLHSIDILTPGEKEFFESMKRLCEASIATGNPIGF